MQRPSLRKDTCSVFIPLGLHPPLLDFAGADFPTGLTFHRLRVPMGGAAATGVALAPTSRHGLGPEVAGRWRGSAAAVPGAVVPFPLGIVAELGD